MRTGPRELWLQVLVGAALGSGLVCEPGCGGGPGAGAGDEVTVARVKGKYKGVNYATWWHDSYEKAESNTALMDLKTTGANCVAIVVTEYMNDKYDWHIRPDAEKTPSVGSVIHAIQEARRAGLQVMLKPHVDGINFDFFRGDIEPRNIARWKDSYRDFVGRWVEVAAGNGVELFCVGTELRSMTVPAHTKFWRRLIESLREDHGYPGLLTYAANWDEYDQVEFWDLLDYAGVDSYFRLDPAKCPTRDELRASWTASLADLRAWQQTHGRPVLLTEIGYVSGRFCAGEPYDPSTAGIYSECCQKRAYGVALELVAAEPWLGGVFPWDWEPFAPHPSARGVSYTPQDKQAQDELAVAYGGYSRPDGSDSSFFGFERSALRWVPQMSPADRAVRWLKMSRQAAHIGQGSLALRCDLHESGHATRDRGEAYVDLRWLGIGDRFDLTNEQVSCWVWCPTGAKGENSRPNGIQLFAKDSQWRSLYGSWEDIIEETWMQVDLTVTNTAPLRGWIESGFDPSDIYLIGVKIGTGRDSAATFSGTIFLDGLNVTGLDSVNGGMPMEVCGPA